MKNRVVRFSAAAWLAITVVLSAASPVTVAEDDTCSASGEYSFVCGLKNPEDLVLVPGTRWIISSGMAADGAIYLIDSEKKTWSVLYPTDTPRNQQDTKTYGACPGAPTPGGFVTHGLNLRPGADRHSTLYAVTHGAREAVDVFDVDANGEMPVLTWLGCIPTPDGMQANSVASLADGSLLVTIPLGKDIPISDAVAGKPTGSVYAWSPGDARMKVVKGSELPYPNGIEVSADGKEFYVASSGLFTVTAYSNTNPARPLRQAGPFAFLPDNVHRARDGKLLTAGLNLADAVCGDIKEGAEFDFGKFSTCPRPFTILAIDPKSMKTSVVATGPANPHFSNITMALPVDGELWIGSFGGDRVAYRSLKLAD